MKQRIRHKSKTEAIWLAILFGPFTWLYTYKDDAVAFWFALVLNVLFFRTIIIPLATWACAIFYAVYRDEKWYKGY